MIEKLIDLTKAEPFFENWPETLIWSCLQGVMGEIYVDHANHPCGAMAVLGDFRFLAGNVRQALAVYEPYEPEGFRIIVPSNDEWARAVADGYGMRAKPYIRYAIKKEGDVFDRKKLESFVCALPAAFQLKPIDQEIYTMCREEQWSRDLVSQYENYEQYQCLGKGFAIFKDHRLVAGASSYASYNRGIEIEIDTRAGWHRQGLALACGARLILECLELGLYPSWDAHTWASVQLAQKLGYHLDHEYLTYIIEN